MSEPYSAAGMDRLMKGVLFTEWRSLMAGGFLSEAGLLAIRGRLIASGEFLPDAARDLMLLDLDTAISEGRGIPLGDMPGRATPDDAAELGTG